MQSSWVSDLLLIAVQSFSSGQDVSCKIKKLFWNKTFVPRILDGFYFGHQIEIYPYFISEKISRLIATIKILRSEGNCYSYSWCSLTILDAWLQCWASFDDDSLTTRHLWKIPSRRRIFAILLKIFSFCYSHLSFKNKIQFCIRSLYLFSTLLNIFIWISKTLFNILQNSIKVIFWLESSGRSESGIICFILWNADFFSCSDL